MARSRERRSRAGRRAGRAFASSKRLGSQRRPSRISTVVTISTSSCVSARSGAENQTKVMQVDQSGAAQQHQRDQPVEFGLPGGADGAAGADRPDQREGRIDRRRRARPWQAEAAAIERPAPRRRPPATSSRSCGCSRRVPSAVSSEARPAPGHRDQRRVEDAPALRAAAAAAAPSSLCAQVVA